MKAPDPRRSDPPGRGWFQMAGTQKGERSLAEQMTGLGPLLERVSGLSILDVGCAEGLISLECMKAGAASVHGLEYVETRLAQARRLFAGRAARFTQTDLHPGRLPDGLEPRYDAVLLLSILHKFPEPEVLLRQAADRAGQIVAVRLPDRVLNDRRSAFRPLDIAAFLADRGLLQFHDAPGPQGEWVGLFERI